MPKRWESQRSFRNSDGEHCPCCGSRNNITYGKIYQQEGGACETRTNGTCNSCWFVTYEISGYIKPILPKETGNG